MENREWRRGKVVFPPGQDCHGPRYRVGVCPGGHCGNDVTTDDLAETVDLVVLSGPRLKRPGGRVEVG